MGKVFVLNDSLREKILQNKRNRKLVADEVMKRNKELSRAYLREFDSAVEMFPLLKAWRLKSIGDHRESSALMNQLNKDFKQAKKIEMNPYSVILPSGRKADYYGRLHKKMGKKVRASFIIDQALSLNLVPPAFYVRNREVDGYIRYKATSAFFVDDPRFDGDLESYMLSEKSLIDIYSYLFNEEELNVNLFSGVNKYIVYPGSSVLDISSMETLPHFLIPLKVLQDKNIQRVIRRAHFLNKNPHLIYKKTNNLLSKEEVSSFLERLSIFCEIYHPNIF